MGSGGMEVADGGSICVLDGGLRVLSTGACLLEETFHERECGRMLKFWGIFNICPPYSEGMIS